MTCSQLVKWLGIICGTPYQLRACICFSPGINRAGETYGSFMSYWLQFLWLLWLLIRTILLLSWCIPKYKACDKSPIWESTNTLKAFQFTTISKWARTSLCTLAWHARVLSLQRVELWHYGSILDNMVPQLHTIQCKQKSVHRFTLNPRKDNFAYTFHWQSWNQG